MGKVYWEMKKFILYTAIAALICLIVTGAQKSIVFAHDAVNICFEIIIPTLFPFFICSGLLIYSGFCEVLAKLFRFCMKPLFNVSPAGSSAFILGIVSGYPLGAVTAGELYSNNYLSKTEAERLLAFCNNSGPLFILASVGIAVYANIKIGIMLYVFHILAALTVGVLFRFYKKNDFTAPPTVMTSPKRSIGEIFNISLQNALSSMLTVCGAVLFFSVVSRLLLNLVSLNPTADALLSGIMEFVTGTVKISQLNTAIGQKLILTSLIVGFAGLSVHAQVMAVTAKYGLSLKPYIAGKILHGVFAAFYTIVYLHFCPITTAVFKPSMSRAFSASSSYELIFAGAVALGCIVFAVLLYIKERKSFILTKNIDRKQNALKKQGH